jgi:hypothetical protein
MCVLRDLSNPQFDSYSLVLVAPSTRRVLANKVHHAFRLPRISVPRWTRAAEQIKATIESRWGIKVIVIDFLRGGPASDTVVIAEVVNEPRILTCPMGHTWVQLDEMAEDEIPDSERSIVQRLLKDGATGRGPFSRFGWIEEILDWISAATAIDRSEFTGDIEQLNASATSALIRVARSNAPGYWFKAAGEPDTREGRVTVTLSELFPEYLPGLIASHDSWNAWLMEDAGRPLGGSVLRKHFLEDVVLRLAELQSASVHHVPALLGSGCYDRRTAVLRDGLPELLPYLEEAMVMQRFDAVPRIGAARLREVAKVFKDACYRLDAIGIPDALIHSDINLNNVLIGDRGCTFTDWAHAWVGNPFVTFEQLRAQLAQDKSTHSWVPRLTEIYQDVWRSVLPVCQFECIFTLVPLIAAASYLCSRRDWLTSEYRHKAQLQSFARSLARQMERAARAVELDHSLCA